MDEGNKQSPQNKNVKKTKYTGLSYQGNTNQNTLRSNIIPVRMATMKKNKPHTREDVRKTSLMYCWQESTMENSQKLQIQQPHDDTFMPFLGIYLEDSKSIHGDA